MGRLRLRASLGVLTVLSLALLATGGATGSTTVGPNIYTIAGIGGFGDTGDGGQATEAQINQPRSLFALPGGGYVFAEPWSNIVRAVQPDGIITTVAGTGAAGFSGDGGSATSAQLNFVHSAAPIPGGGYAVADTLNNRIRKIAPNGTITTVVGDGVGSYFGDGGPASQARINNPRGVAVASDGSIFIPDTNNHRIRKVSTNGTITTVAGTGVQGFSGDGGPATSAMLSIPFCVAPTADGGFLICDIGNQRIRKVSAGGTITTVAGNGVNGFSGDGGPATAAAISDPHNVAPLPDGGFLIGDASNERVRRVWPDGTITTIAGDGSKAFGGDGGPATLAKIDTPKAVAVDAAGNILIGDEQNSRIRFVGTPVAPANVSAPTITGLTQQGAVLRVATGGWSGTGPTFTYQWRRCDSSGASCSDIANATAKSYALNGADVGSTIRAQVTGANASGSATATSTQSGVVSAPIIPPTNTSPPTISGVAKDGQTLTADPGTWSGAPPITYAYQWRRCNSSGSACTDIGGATAQTYQVASADVGSTIRVRVAASNGAANSAYASSVLADAPTSFWRFDETSGPLVDQTGFKNGTYVNSPTRGVVGLVPGDSDGAVSLNGSSQYLDVPADPAWTPNAFSIEVSVKPSVLPDNRTIWSTIGPSATGWWLNSGPDGAIRWFIGNGSSFLFGSDGPVLNAGSTYDLVATYDGTNGRVYVNGALVSTGPAVTMSGNVGNNVSRFGAYSTGPGQYWPGVIDDASFYSTVLTPAQIAAHYNAFSNGSSATSNATAVVTAAAPANTALPTTSGTAQETQPLTADPGTWSGTTPIAFTYQWRRCDSSGANCSPIGGATQQTYEAATADVGSTLRVAVSASNTAGSGGPAVSAQTPVVTSAPQGATVTFTLAAGGDDGDVAVRTSSYPPTGTADAADSGNVFTAGRRFVGNNFQVFDALLRFDTSALPDGATVTGATLKLWVNSKKDADNRNLVGEWYPPSQWPINSADWTLNPGSTALAGADVTAISTGATSSFALQNLASVSRTGYTGLRLGVDGGQPTGDNLVQFATIEGGKPAQLVVTYTNGPPTPPANTAPPTISGTPQETQTLTADPGTWTGTAPVNFTYQWLRCDGSGANCVNIVNATQSTYVVATADIGARLRVSVSASNTAGSAGPVASAPTAVITAAPNGGTLTFTVAAGGDDGNVDKTASTYPPGGSADPYTTGTVFTAGRRAVFGTFQVFDALVRFDTSALPDNATVTGATLKIWVNGKTDGDNRNLVGEWYDAAQWPIDGADYTLNPGNSALAGTDITTIGTGATSSFSLQNLGNVSRTGFTGLRMGIDGGQPSGDNYVQFASLEGGKPAQLVVTYSNGPPTPPANTVPPTISGTAQTAQTLNADPGTWTGSAPINFTYQWNRCDSAGANCLPIGGATQQTYLVASGDVGSTLRVAVSASNTAGSAGPVTSAQTAVVTTAPSGGTVTFTLAAGGDDGDVTVRAGTYPPSAAADSNSSGTVFTAARRFVLGSYQVFDALLRFDTSSLPDNATVTAATLKLWANAKTDADNRNLVGEWYPASQWPIDGADWTVSPGNAALAGADVTAIGTGATSSFALQGLGSISTTGLTGLRLGIDGGQPAGDNYVQFASLEGGKPAQLVVTYTTP